MNTSRLTALLLVASGLAHAHEAPIATPAAHHRLDFGLNLSSTRTEPAYGATPVATRTRRLGVHWREPFGERVQLGMLGGYSYMSQDSNPLLAGKDLDGYHAGFTVHGSLLRFTGGQLYVSARYVYESARHESETQNLRLSLDTWYAALGFSVEPGQRAQVFFGADYGRLDGTESATGTVNQTRGVELSRAGGFAGVGLRDDRDGAVGLVARAGLERGVSFYFKRLF